MKVNVELRCPVSVIVDTETGKIESVHVWDEQLDTDNVMSVHENDYVPATDADRAASPDGFASGTSIYRPIDVESPEAVRAIEVMRTDPLGIEWPAWQFDS